MRVRGGPSTCSSIGYVVRFEPLAIDSASASWPKFVDVVFGSLTVIPLLVMLIEKARHPSEDGIPRQTPQPPGSVIRNGCRSPRNCEKIFERYTGQKAPPALGGFVPQSHIHLTLLVVQVQHQRSRMPSRPSEIRELTISPMVYSGSCIQPLLLKAVFAGSAHVLRRGCRDSSRCLWSA